MPRSIQDCITAVRNGTGIDYDECHAAARYVYDTLGGGNETTGTGLSELAGSLKGTRNAVYHVEISRTANLGHGFAMTQHGISVRLFQAYIRGYSLRQWLDQANRPHIADTNYSPGAATDHRMVKCVNLLEYDLADISDHTAWSAAFRKLFGGNPTLTVQLAMLSTSGVRVECTWKRQDLA